MGTPQARGSQQAGNERAHASLPYSPLPGKNGYARVAPWLAGTVIAEIRGMHDAGTGKRLKLPASAAGGGAPGSLDDREILEVARKISRTYMLAPEAAAWIVRKADAAAGEAGVDPLLLLAVVGVESRFNPYAGSRAGAKGFTQVMPRAHPEAVALVEAGGGSVLDPEDNLRLGAGILKKYLGIQQGDTRRGPQQYDGALKRALQQYNGSLGDDTYKYANKVLHVYNRLKNPTSR